MDQVWAIGAPATARNVHDRLKGQRSRAYTTVMTTMDRLHRKRLLTREKVGLAWLYEARLTRDEYARSVAHSLAEHIVDEHGELGLAAFVDAAADQAMLDRLAKLIADRKRK
jgi:predicted transcriptional regulator